MAQTRHIIILHDEISYALFERQKLDTNQLEDLIKQFLKKHTESLPM